MSVCLYVIEIGLHIYFLLSLFNKSIFLRIRDPPTYETIDNNFQMSFKFRQIEYGENSEFNNSNRIRPLELITWLVLIILSTDGSELKVMWAMWTLPR